VVSSLELIDGKCYLSATGKWIYMGGSILGIVLDECNWIQELRGWYHPWNYLMGSVN
jgi:hypothetical protein